VKVWQSGREIHHGFLLGSGVLEGRLAETRLIKEKANHVSNVYRQLLGVYCLVLSVNRVEKLTFRMLAG